MQAAVDRILSAENRIDALVNNAGYGSYGAIEDVPIEEVRHQFEVNVFGLAQLSQLVLPCKPMFWSEISPMMKCYCWM